MASGAPENDDAGYGPTEERARRIVESAIALAEDGGFDAVRLRDVAAHAGVALGTVYKRFTSKEDILVAVFESEFGVLEEFLRARRPREVGCAERLAHFFDQLTVAFFARPKLSRAVLRAIASGDLGISDKVQRFHDRVNALIAEAIVGEEDAEHPDLDAEQVQRLAVLLSQVWFAALVGWMGGLIDQQHVVVQVRDAATLLLAGMRAERREG